MKRLLIIAILLMSSMAWAGSTTVVVGQGAGPSIFTGTTSDACMFSSNATWSTAIAGDGTLTGYDTASIEIQTTKISTKYYIMRAYLYFDTSGLPDDCTIDSATLYLYTQNGSPTNSAQVQAFASTAADPFATSKENFNAFGDVWSDATSMTANQWGTITLNSTARAAISKTGATKICLREYAHDVGNSENATDYSITWDSADGTNKPYLSITYH